REGWGVRGREEECVGGLGLVAGVGMAVSMFGSSRAREGTAQYELATRISAGLVRAGYAVITGGGPGIMEAANKGAASSRGISVGPGIQLPQEQGLHEYVDIGLAFRHF